jgi:hypothetical protein
MVQAAERSSSFGGSTCILWDSSTFLIQIAKAGLWVSED